MPEEEKNPPKVETPPKAETSPNGDGKNQYIEAIKELKEKTVPKEEYEKLKAENKQLVDDVLNGKEIKKPVVEEKVDIKELRNDLFNKEGDSNLEVCKKALKLRKEIMSKGGIDPFLPIGHKISPTDEDIAGAERVAKVMQECIDFANGDSELFTNELQRRTIDTGSILSRARHR